MLEREIYNWFQRRARQPEQALAGPIVDATEDPSVRSDLSWLRDMASRFVVAWVG